MEYAEKSTPTYHKFIKKLAKEQKIEGLKGLLLDLDPVEIANSFLQLKLKHQLTVISMLDREKASDVLSQLRDHGPVLEEILKHLSSQELSGFIEDMDKDDAADMLSILDEKMATEVLDELPKEDKVELSNLMQYDEESAGGIMDPMVVSIQKEQSVEEASQDIKKLSQEKEIDDFYNIYVVDEYEHLIGSISLTQLFLAEKDAQIKDIMDPDLIAVNVEKDEERDARLAKEYDMVTVPVIDKHLKLVGRITSDDIMDVFHEEHQEDIGQIAGTGDEEVLETSLLKASKDRLPWLLLGLAGGALAALVMQNYEEDIARVPKVAYFIPVIAALGGNIAIQSSSLVVRGLATGEIRTQDLIKRAWKEIRVGLLNGFICAVLLAGLAWHIYGNWEMGVTTGGALLVVVFLAALVGTTVPILLKRMQMDPAIATGPFITTTNDILGIIIYLAITISVYNQQFI